MKKPNYKDKDTFEQKVNEYIKKLIEEEEPSAEYAITSESIKHYNIVIVNFESLSSTHTLAEKYDGREIPDNFVIVFKAKTQTKGVGQRNNTFQSPEGGLYVSFILKNKEETSKFSILSLLTSLSVKESIEEYLENYDFSFDKELLGLKWINDIYFKDCKLSGVLVSTSNLASSSTSVNNTNQLKLILSAGVNLNTIPDFVENVCCIKDVVLKDDFEVEVEEFFTLVINNLLKRYSQFTENDLDELMSNITEALVLKNQNVDIVDPITNEILISGIFNGINEDGNAIIEDNNKKQITATRGRMIIQKEISKVNTKDEPKIDEDDEEEDFEVVTKSHTVSQIIDISNIKHQDKVEVKSAAPIDHKEKENSSIITNTHIVKPEVCLKDKNTTTISSVIDYKNNEIDKIKVKDDTDDKTFNCYCKLSELINPLNYRRFPYFLFAISAALTYYYLKKK